MDKRKTNWSVMVPWLLSLVTIGVGIWQFSTLQEQANRQPFLQKQFELSFRASEVASILATESDSEAWGRARKEFWLLYWGPLSIVEDLAVEAEMKKFGTLLLREGVLPTDLPLTYLQVPSYELAHVVRKLVGNSWDVELSELEGNRQIALK